MRNVNVIKLELKYCENCGGLWIRRTGDRFLYCHGCRQIHPNYGRSDQTRVNQERGRPGRMRKELDH